MFKSRPAPRVLPKRCPLLYRCVRERLNTEGKNIVEIAATLGISDKTVAAHRLKRMESVQLRFIVDLTRYAIRLVWSSPNPMTG